MKEKVCLIVATFAFFSCLSCAAAEETFLSKKAQEWLALKTLKSLITIPDQRLAKNQAQKEGMKKVVARAIIERFGGQIKTGKESFQGVEVTSADIKNGLRILDNYTSEFADREFGNSDGVCTPEEFQKFQQSPEAGLKVLREMMIDYRI